MIAAAGAAGALGHDDVPLSRRARVRRVLPARVRGLRGQRRPRRRRGPRATRASAYRPVAAGELDPAAALALGAALMLAGLGAVRCVRPLLVAGRRRLPRADAQLHGPLAAHRRARRRRDRGRVRAARRRRRRRGAGDAVALVRARVTFSALFVAAGKRHAELRRDRAGDELARRRRVLRFYTPARLRLILLGERRRRAVRILRLGVRAAEVDGVPWRPLTIVPFAAVPAALRGARPGGHGEAPEELLLRDRCCSSPGSSGWSCSRSASMPRAETMSATTDAADRRRPAATTRVTRQRLGRRRRARARRSCAASERRALAARRSRVSAPRPARSRAGWAAATATPRSSPAASCSTRRG